MILRKGKLSYNRVHHDEFKFFTGNAMCNAKGELVMGRGAALEVKTQWPQVSRQFGRLVLTNIRNDKRAYNRYGILLLYELRLGVFQVKNHYLSKANLSLIGYSAEMLKRFARRQDKTIHMNYPGIGNGGLHYKKVQTILDQVGLPDNVILYVVD